MINYGYSDFIWGSSNGRTIGSGPINWGSNPYPQADENRLPK